ncbi:MAG TPA: hypothetical protein VJJ76_01480 [archaeon]|nr:hypothetical protein [archaeon]
MQRLKQNNRIGSACLGGMGYSLAALGFAAANEASKLATQYSELSKFVPVLYASTLVLVAIATPLILSGALGVRAHDIPLYLKNKLTIQI